MPAKPVPGSYHPKTPIKIIFPELPYTELRSNYHKINYWYRRAEVSKIAREEAYLLGREVRPSKPLEHCEIEEVFTIPTRRRMDVEGLMGGAKPWIDGLKDAGLIVDDDWGHVRRLSGRIVYQKGVEQTEIIITPLIAQ